jgi:hypothetical protein
MGKMVKESEKKNEEVLEAQASARALLRKKVTVEALTLLFTHTKAELEVMKQMQSDTILRQANMRNERNAARVQAGLAAGDADEAWQQQMIDKHNADQEALLVDQKAQFVEVYGKSDELADTIWSHRNSEGMIINDLFFFFFSFFFFVDLNTKLDEVVPATPGPLQSPDDLAKELADLQGRQDSYRETQEGLISKTDETVKGAQVSKVDEVFAAGKKEAQELVDAIDKEEEAKLGAFCVAAEAVN